RDQARRPRRRDRRERAREGDEGRADAAGAGAAVGPDEEPSVLHAGVLLAAPGRVSRRSRRRRALLLLEPRGSGLLALVSTRRIRGRRPRADRGARTHRLPARSVAARAPAALRLDQQLAAGL